MQAHDYIELVKNKEINIEQIITALFNKIDQADKDLGAFLLLDREGALLQARELDKRVKKNDIPPLVGLPVAINDNICTQGIETTAASRMLKGFIPPYDATVVKKIKDAGGIIIGKTNVAEFGIGSSSENSSYKVTVNPWDKTRVSGGSSGGSAAAIAANEALIALGDDSWSSGILSASFCGINGFRPTNGLISRYGVISHTSSLNEVEIFAKGIKDIALLMNTICGFDHFDSISKNANTPDFLSFCYDGIKDLVFGIPKEYFDYNLDLGIEEKIRESINIISSLGGKIEEISLPNLPYALSTYSIIATAEASSNLARYDGVQYGLREESDDLEEMYFKSRGNGFGSEVKRTIILGNYFLSSNYYDEYYLKAHRVKTLILNDFQNAFQKCDILIGPTSPLLPPRIAENNDKNESIQSPNAFTVAVSLAGLPALNIKCGAASLNNLPIGLQIIGHHFEEEKVLRVAYNLQKNLTI